jgi:hypothetical protein
MNALEELVRPVVKPLIDGNRSARDLTEAEAETLARWALKTAFVSTSVSSTDLNLPHAHVVAVRDEQPLPLGVALFGGRAERFLKVRSRIDAKWYVSADNVDVEALSASSYKATFQFGHAVFCLAYLPPGHEYRFAIRHTMHHPIWPPALSVAHAPSMLEVGDWHLFHLQFHYSLNATNRARWLSRTVRYRGDSFFEHDAFTHVMVGEAGGAEIPCPCGSGRGYVDCHGDQRENR